MTSNKIAFCATVTFASLAATATLASGIVPAVHFTKSEGIILAQVTSPPPAATSKEPVQSGQSGAADPGMQQNRPEMVVRRHGMGGQGMGMQGKSMGRGMEHQGQNMRQGGTTKAPM